MQNLIGLIHGLIPKMVLSSIDSGRSSAIAVAIRNIPYPKRSGLLFLSSVNCLEIIMVKFLSFDISDGEI